MIYVDCNSNQLFLDDARCGRKGTTVNKYI